MNRIEEKEGVMKNEKKLWIKKLRGFEIVTISMVLLLMNHPSQSLVSNAIDDLSNGMSAYVFPNPIKEGFPPKLHLTIGEFERLFVHVYDVSGDLVFAEPLEPTGTFDANNNWIYESEMDSSVLHSGVYIGVVRSDNKGRDAVSEKFRFTVIK